MGAMARIARKGGVGRHEVDLASREENHLRAPSRSLVISQSDWGARAGAIKPPVRHRSKRDANAAPPCRSLAWAKASR